MEQEPFLGGKTSAQDKPPSYFNQHSSCWAAKRVPGWHCDQSWDIHWKLCLRLGWTWNRKVDFSGEAERSHTSFSPVLLNWITLAQPQDLPHYHVSIFFLIPPLPMEGIPLSENVDKLSFWGNMKDFIPSLLLFPDENKPAVSKTFEYTFLLISEDAMMYVHQEEMWKLYLFFFLTAVLRHGCSFCSHVLYFLFFIQYLRHFFSVLSIHMAMDIWPDILFFLRLYNQISCYRKPM